MKNDRPFGGRVIILDGSICQFPVGLYDSTAARFRNFMEFSSLWPILKTLTLTENMRAKAEEKEYADSLL